MELRVVCQYKTTQHIVGPFSSLKNKKDRDDNVRKHYGQTFIIAVK